MKNREINNNATKNKINKKLLLGIGAGIFLIFVGIFLGIVVAGNSTETAEAEYSDGELIGNKKDKFMVFYNLDFLTMAYNIKFSTTVAEDIENYVLSDEEMQFAGENNSQSGDSKIYYDATIDVDDFVNFDAYTSNFTVDISDGRQYDVMTRTDSLDDNYTYLYMALKRNGSEKIIVYVYGDETYANEFAEFARNMMDATEIVYNKNNE